MSGNNQSERLILIISAVLILGTLAVLFVPAVHSIFFPSAKPKTLMYNGFEFEDHNVTWTTLWESQRQLYILSFHFTPPEVESIVPEGALDDNFFENQPIYITFDPGEGKNITSVAIAVAELSLNLAKGFDLNLAAACTRNETVGCQNLPIVTCNDKNLSVIYVRYAQGTKIMQDENCVTIQGQDRELLKAVDSALFRLYKIIN